MKTLLKVGDLVYTTGVPYEMCSPPRTLPPRIPAIITNVEPESKNLVYRILFGKRPALLNNGYHTFETGNDEVATWVAPHEIREGPVVFDFLWGLGF